MSVPVSLDIKLEGKIEDLFRIFSIQGFKYGTKINSRLYIYGIFVLRDHQEVQLDYILIENTSKGKLLCISENGGGLISCYVKEDPAPMELLEDIQRELLEFVQIELERKDAIKFVVK